jgi:hypothetical protein
MIAAAVQITAADLGKGRYVTVDALASAMAAASARAGLNAMSSVLPSKLTNRQCRYQAPRVERTAIGLTSSSCNRRTGSHPSRVRACEMPDLPVTLIVAEGSRSH